MLRADIGGGKYYHAGKPKRKADIRGRKIDI